MSVERQTKQMDIIYFFISNENGRPFENTYAFTSLQHKNIMHIVTGVGMADVFVVDN